MDWQDMTVLEEFLDARMLAQADSGGRTLPDCPQPQPERVRDGTPEGSILGRSSRRTVLGAASLAITQAFLLPFTPTLTNLQATTPVIESVILSRLRTVVPASPLHLTLVEAVRRQYRLFAQAVDRADKEAGAGYRGANEPRGRRNRRSF